MHRIGNYIIVNAALDSNSDYIPMTGLRDVSASSRKRKTPLRGISPKGGKQESM
jgi:hypothetical protein